MAGENRKDVGGFVVGPNPRAELAEMRKILSSSGPSRAARLSKNIRESKKRAREFAERDVAADLET